MATELTETPIDLPTFLKLYTDSTINNKTNDKQSAEIIDILGGIDNIVKTFINVSIEYNECNILNTDQMSKIHAVISQTEQTQNEEFDIFPQNEEFEEFATIPANKLESTEGYTYFFHKNSTFLHLILCNDQIADTLIHFVFNKCIIYSTCILSMIWTVMAVFWLNAHSVAWFIILELTWECYLILYLLLLILACNRKVFWLVTKEFDFAMKCYYALGSMVANSIYIRCLNFEFYRMLYIDMSSVVITLVVVLFSLFEGYHISWKVIFSFGFCISAIISFTAIRFTFWYDEPESYMHIIPGTDMKIGLLSYFSAAYRIMSLFLWKQTIMSAWARGKSCISIYVTPKVVWMDQNIQGQLTL